VGEGQGREGMLGGAQKKGVAKGKGERESGASQLVTSSVGAFNCTSKQVRMGMLTGCGRSEDGRM